jgi:uncharacterized protein YutE (UPF0331/DUF86 family)
LEILSGQKVISKPLARRMIQMCGFRNRIIHEYEKTNMKIVHAVWKKNLPDIDKFCKSVVVKFIL